MGSLKTLLVLLVLSPSASFAANGSLTSTFASCAGRYSAEVEHSWLTSDGQSEFHESRKQQFLDLIEALAPQDSDATFLNLRLVAKVAHADLLSTAAFSVDEERSEWALMRASSEIQFCSGFLLES